MVTLDLLTDYATTNLVTLSEAKQHLRIASTYDDTNVRTLLDTARQMVERETNRSVLNQKWKMTLDYFPNEIYLPKGFIKSVDSVKYYNTSGTLTTLTKDTNYTVTVNCDDGRILPVTSWPADVKEDIRNAVEITFTAGYGEVRGQLTSWAEAATLLMLSKLYYNMDTSKPLEHIIKLNTHYSVAWYKNDETEPIRFR